MPIATPEAYAQMQPAPGGSASCGRVSPLREVRPGGRPGWGRMGVMEHQNLLGGPPATMLPEDPATAELSAGVDPATVAAAHPGCLAAWAALADLALAKGETSRVQ